MHGRFLYSGKACLAKIECRTAMISTCTTARKWYCLHRPAQLLQGQSVTLLYDTTPYEGKIVSIDAISGCVTPPIADREWQFMCAAMLFVHFRKLDIEFGDGSKEGDVDPCVA